MFRAHFRLFVLCRSDEYAPLRAQDLFLLSTVRIVTGYVSIELPRNSGLTNLQFLENLEEIGSETPAPSFRFFDYSGNITVRKRTLL